MSRRSTGNFRQLRVTATHELPSTHAPWGRFSVAVYAKPLNTEWKEQHLVFRRAVWAPTARLETSEECVAAIVDMLSEVFLQPAVTDESR